jgi:tight adherence protein C
MLLILSFMATVMFLFLFVLFSVHERKDKMKKRIETFVGVDQQIEKSTQQRGKTALKEKIADLREKGRDYFAKKLSSQKEEKLDKKLLQLGNPWNITSAEFQLYIVVCQIALPILLVVYGIISKFGTRNIIILFIVGVLGSFFLPDLYIDSKIKSRYRKALKELPDFLDLLTISLEAGLGFDLALNKVVSKGNGTLYSEFHICLEEIRLGKTRKESLSGIKDRLDFTELKSLINSILQAEKLGMSMVQIFRIKSEEEREKRRQRAEEAAMKVPVKILFPLVMFIFPSIFIVILGPAVLELVTKGFQ